MAVASHSTQGTMQLFWEPLVAGILVPRQSSPLRLSFANTALFKTLPVVQQQDPSHILSFLPFLIGTFTIDCALSGNL